MSETKVDPALCRRLADVVAGSLVLLAGGDTDAIASQLTAAADLAERHEQTIADRDVEAKVSGDRLHQLVTKQLGGLTFAECEVAARNWGIDLTCGECASLFYTGHSSAPHDAGCKTRERPTLTEGRVREVVRAAVVAEYGRPTHSEESDESALARRVATRAAKELAGAVVWLSDQERADLMRLRSNESTALAAVGHLDLDVVLQCGRTIALLDRLLAGSVIEPAQRDAEFETRISMLTVGIESARAGRDALRTQREADLREAFVEGARWGIAYGIEGGNASSAAAEYARSKAGAP